MDSNDVLLQVADCFSQGAARSLAVAVSPPSSLREFAAHLPRRSSAIFNRADSESWRRLRFSDAPLAHRLDREVKGDAGNPGADRGRGEIISRRRREAGIRHHRCGCFAAERDLPLRAGYLEAGLVIERGERERVKVPGLQRPFVNLPVGIFWRNSLKAGLSSESGRQVARRKRPETWVAADTSRNRPAAPAPG